MAFKIEVHAAVRHAVHSCLFLRRDLFRGCLLSLGFSFLRFGILFSGFRTLHRILLKLIGFVYGWEVLPVLD